MFTIPLTLEFDNPLTILTSSDVCGVYKIDWCMTVQQSTCVDIHVYSYIIITCMFTTKYASAYVGKAYCGVLVLLLGGSGNASDFQFNLT